MSSSSFASGSLEVSSPDVTYTDATITTDYTYETTAVKIEGSKVVATPTTTNMKIVTERVVPKTGVMIVGWGGNNGTTVTGGILANKLGLTWRTKEGVRKADYVGSVTQASTVRLGSGPDGSDVYVPFNSVVPMLHPNDMVLTGWDISGMNLGDAMERAAVLPVDLQRQLKPHMDELKPMPSIYFPDFIAANQGARADNVLAGSKLELMERIRKDIRDFKAAQSLDKVIVLWSANTERFSELIEGVNDTEENLMKAIAADHPEVSPSTLFAVASILEGSSYINGSPQNTFVPGCAALAETHDVFIAGDDFKSGQTKMKSVLVDFLVSAGIKPVSIASYNHLGNNDGKNLSAPQQFRSKEISKSNVVDDMIASNRILYAEDEHIDHCVVIKYVPYVGDSKRALDEYTSEIFLGGLNTISMHNTCEDSLLASPLIIDLVVLAEVCERIKVQRVGVDAEPMRLHSVLSLLSYLCKAPLVPSGTPVINALFLQRMALTNFFRACVGLRPDNHMLLEHRLHDAGVLAREAAGAGAGAAVGTGAGAGAGASVEADKVEAMRKEAAEKTLDA